MGRKKSTAKANEAEQTEGHTSQEQTDIEAVAGSQIEGAGVGDLQSLQTQREEHETLEDDEDIEDEDSWINACASCMAWIANKLFLPTDNPEDTSIKKIFWNIFVSSMLNAGAFTFSLAMLVISVLISRQEVGEENSAAAGLAITGGTAIAYTTLAHTLLTSLIASNLKGQLTFVLEQQDKLKASSLSPQELQALMVSLKQFAKANGREADLIYDLSPTKASLKAQCELWENHITLEISRLERNATLASLPSILIGVPLLFNLGNIYHALGYDTNVTDKVSEFTSSWSFALLLFLLRMGPDQILTGMDKRKILTISVLPPFLISIIIAYCLTFVADMGLSGIGLSLLIGNILENVALHGYMAFGEMFRYTSVLPSNHELQNVSSGSSVNQLSKSAEQKSERVIDFSFYRSFFSRMVLADSIQLKFIFKNGLLRITPIIFFEVVGGVVMPWLAKWCGANNAEALSNVAALTPAATLQSVSLISILSIGQAASQWISQARGGGEKKSTDAVNFARAGLIETTLPIIALCSIFAARPDLLTSIISGDVSDEVKNIVKIYVPITALGIFFDALRYYFLSILRGNNDHNVPAAISVANIVAGIGFAALLAFETNLGVYGLAVGQTVFYGVAAAMLGKRAAQYMQVPKIEQNSGTSSPPAGLSRLFPCWPRKPQREISQSDETTHLLASVSARRPSIV